MKREFDHCAADYARYRPPYPTDVFDELDRMAAHRVPRRVADVGAGTGIFARLLARSGWRVVAIEPSLAMLAHVGGDDKLNIVRVCATAEATGLCDASVGLVTAAQAFHWFNPPYALAEIARILAPGGSLALIWNNRDATRSAFVESYETLIARYNPAYEREYRTQDWAGKIAVSGAFEPAEHHVFAHDWVMMAEDFVGFSRSVSYIRNVLSREDMPRFEGDLRGLLREHFNEGSARIPLRTEMWSARRLA